MNIKTTIVKIRRTHIKQQHMMKRININDGLIWVMNYNWILVNLQRSSTLAYLFCCTAILILYKWVMTLSVAHKHYNISLNKAKAFKDNFWELVVNKQWLSSLRQKIWPNHITFGFCTREAKLSIINFCLLLLNSLKMASN